MAVDASPRLRMAGVQKRFGATQALGGVDLEVRAGEVHGLIGENGAGKSTLMKVLAGAVAPDAGRMWLDGDDYRPADPAAARRAGVAMIHQELSLAPHLSVAENVLLGIEPTFGPFVRRGEVVRRAAAALVRVGRPDIPLDVPVRRLGIAERQLVEIARSVATGSRLIVLDEPTSSLARADVERLFALARTLRDDGHAVVHISHFLEEVREITDRFTVLRDGVAVGTGDTKATGVDALVRLMIGRSVDELYVRSHRSPGEVVLEVADVAGVPRPTAASFVLRRGEVLGIAGLVGAGRTELLRSIFGLDPVVRGRIRVGAFAGGTAPSASWRRGMGMVSEDRKEEGLAVQASIADNLLLPRLPRLSSPSSRDAASRRWIDRLDIRCRTPHQRVAELSGGNQQKIALARLLHAEVDVLLLDEPTRGVDIGARARIYELIDELALGGKAVLLVSSYLPELCGMCDRIAVMCRGRLGPARPVTELDEHAILLEATGAADP
jgi:ribose transport system ATP-binding protein